MTTSVLAAGVLEDTIRAFFQGLPIGAGFALVAMSFVLTYKTSGVFNLAFGAQAFISAATYFELHVRRDWPIWSAVLVAVVLVAPVLGLLLERLIFRHVHAASGGVQAGHLAWPARRPARTVQAHRRLQPRAALRRGGHHPRRHHRLPAVRPLPRHPRRDRRVRHRGGRCAGPGRPVPLHPAWDCASGRWCRAPE